MRADIGTAPDFLRDIGIDVSEAQAEAMRFPLGAGHTAAQDWRRNGPVYIAVFAPDAGESSAERADAPNNLRITKPANAWLHFRRQA